MPKKVLGPVLAKTNLFFTFVTFSAAIVIALSFLIMLSNAKIVANKNKWCGNKHETTSVIPTKLKTSADFFEKGNYQYDTGDCVAAVASYTQALKLNSKYAEAYNNRAYTYMMLGDYKSAIVDLDAAINLRPTYVNALMNRGDIYNYYFNQDKNKDIADYDKVIAQGANALKGQATCGHRLMAAYEPNLFLVFWLFIIKAKHTG